ncbi:hypothetical protein ACTFIZ_004771 [Dictyostelium cf. discoideum]
MRSNLSQEEANNNCLIPFKKKQPKTSNPQIPLIANLIAILLEKIWHKRNKLIHDEIVITIHKEQIIQEKTSKYTTTYSVLSIKIQGSLSMIQFRNRTCDPFYFSGFDENSVLITTKRSVLKCT